MTMTFPSTFMIFSRPRRTCSALDVVGAVIRRHGDLHDLEIVRIFDVLLRNFAFVRQAVSRAQHHLAQVFELAAKPAAHHEDHVKAHVVGMARGAASRLEFLDRPSDRRTEAPVRRFGEPEVTIFQERPQPLGGPGRAFVPRNDDLWLRLRHRCSPYFFASAGSGGLLPSGMPTRPAMSTDE